MISSFDSATSVSALPLQLLHVLTEHDHDQAVLITRSGAATISTAPADPTRTLTDERTIGMTPYELGEATHPPIDEHVWTELRGFTWSLLNEWHHDRPSAIRRAREYVNGVYENRTIPPDQMRVCVVFDLTVFGQIAENSPSSHDLAALAHAVANAQLPSPSDTTVPHPSQTSLPPTGPPPPP